MKKYIFISIVLLLSGTQIFSQSRITSKQLVGEWKLIKGEGKDFEEDVIGSVFHFQSSGIVVSDKSSGNANNSNSQKKGTYKVTGNTIVLYEENENPKKDKGLVLEVSRYEENLLYLFETDTKTILVFEQIKSQ